MGALLLRVLELPDLPEDQQVEGEGMSKRRTRLSAGALLVGLFSLFGAVVGGWVGAALVWAVVGGALFLAYLVVVVVEGTWRPKP